jgi:hypothetical protein
VRKRARVLRSRRCCHSEHNRRDHASAVHINQVRNKFLFTFSSPDRSFSMTGSPSLIILNTLRRVGAARVARLAGGLTQPFCPSRGVHPYPTSTKTVHSSRQSGPVRSQRIRDESRAKTPSMLDKGSYGAKSRDRGIAMISGEPGEASKTPARTCLVKP